MTNETQEVVDQLVLLLGSLGQDERQQALAALDLVFCGSCGLMQNSTEIARSSTVGNCVHAKPFVAPQRINDGRLWWEDRTVEIKNAALEARKQLPWLKR